MKKYDVIVLTDPRYVTPDSTDPFINNILLEDGMVSAALEKKGLRVHRASWDDPVIDWNDTFYALFRSTWDYFNRFREFDSWLRTVSRQTTLVNPYELVRWNLDKHYLQDVSRNGVPVPPTLFIEKGERRTLAELAGESGWREMILKPVVSGGARHTYRIGPGETSMYEKVYRELVENESLMLQEFQQSVITRGEVTLMVFGGKFSHAVLKKARKGDFRVQDDFGGTVHPYHPKPGEISFAEKAVAACGQTPVYARVDTLTDNNGRVVLSELELIEPELWFRFRPEAATLMANAFIRHLNKDSH